MQDRVECFSGVKGVTTLEPGHVAVCTFEKANRLLNRCFELGTIPSLGCLVVDELHMLGDGRRGQALEMMLSKACGFGRHDIGDACPRRGPQVVGLSATIANREEIARWLQARLVPPAGAADAARPVKLDEYVILSGRGMLPAGGHSSGSDDDDSSKGQGKWGMLCLNMATSGPTPASG